MKKNWLGYLGFIGLLGLLGLITDNPGYYGFFGFFGWFGFLNIVHDERLAENINKSCRNVFITSLLLSLLVIVAGTFAKNVGVFVLGFAINFSLMIIVFTISLQIYDKVIKG